MRASATSRISTAHAAQQAAPGVAANNKADDSSPFAMLLAATAATKDAGDQKPSMDGGKDPSASQQPQAAGTDTQTTAATPQTGQAQPTDKPAKTAGKSDKATDKSGGDEPASADLVAVDPSTLPQVTAALQPPPAPLQNPQPQTPPADDSAGGMDVAAAGAARPAAPQATIPAADSDSDTDTKEAQAPQAAPVGAAATDTSASSDTAAAKPAVTKSASVTTGAATDSKSASAKSMTAKSADAKSTDTKSTDTKSTDTKSAAAKSAIAKTTAPQTPAADTDSDTSTDETQAPAPQAIAATTVADIDTSVDEAPAPQATAASTDTSVKTAAVQPATVTPAATKAGAAKPETGKSDAKDAPPKTALAKGSDPRDTTAKTAQDAADPNAVPAAKTAPQTAPASNDANTPASTAIAAQSGVPQGPATGAMPALTQHIQVSAQPQPNMPALAVEITAKSQAGAKQFDIRLDPPELGRVEVRLSIDATGKASAHLTADQPQTLDLLRKDSTSLTQALRDAGLDVNQNGLNFSLRQQAGDTHQGQNGGGNRSAAGRGQMLTASKSIDATQASAAYRAPADGRLDIRV